MRIARLVLRNWLRFAGETDVALDGGVYAVTARYVGEPTRSNWAGKSAVLEAVRFALYGEHRHAREDDWITRGEKDGGVALTLSDGTVVERTRKIGSSTQLAVTSPDGSKASGEAAQRLIVERVGLTLEDFEATCWVGQKQLARLVTARPADRMRVVAGWLALEPLQRCEARARKVLAERGREATELAAKAAGVDRAIEELMGDVPAREGMTRAESLLAAARDAEVEASRAEAAVADAEAVEQGARDARERERRRAEVAELKRQAEEATAKIRRLGGPKAVAVAEAAERARDEAAGLEREAAAALRERARVDGGTFDGACPVLPGFACPAKSAINGRRAELTELRRRAQAEYDDAARTAASARAEATEARRTAQDALALRERRAVLGQQIDAAAAALGPAPAVPEARPGAPGIDDAIQALTNARSRHRGLLAGAERVARLEVEAAGLRERAERARADAAAASGAVRVFGRAGAQRVVAERALAEIEAGANALLAASGIDLTVTVRWSREGDGLASSCDVCGAAFPASAKAKACASCGTARGPKVVERLDVELSDRSGAAEDLVGAALQLSATAWLRRDRGFAWSVALVDEPFAALDEANRRAFATQLATMLRGEYGFEQALVIAHQQDAVDAFPLRLEVEADAEGSWLA